MPRSRKWLAVLAGVACAAAPLLAVAQESGTKTARELRASYDKALQGKTVGDALPGSTQTHVHGGGINR